MSKKVLVTYASRAGSTAGVAEAIGKCLTARGASVDVEVVTAVKDINSYQAVVIGSTIRGGGWLPEGAKFLLVNQAALRKIPCAVFMVCMTMAMKNPKYREGVADWMAPARRILKPVKEGYFAGELDFDKLPLTFDVLTLSVSSKFGFPAGDHRDWNVINAWANEVGSLMGLPV